MKDLPKSALSSGLEVTHGSGNVFADLGFDDEEAADLLVRSRLMSRVQRYVHEQQVTAAEAAERLGVPPPRLADLMRGEIDRFPIDVLVRMLARVGVVVEVHFAEPREA